MAGRNRKISAIKDIDELEKEQKVEEKVEEPKEDIQKEPEIEEKVEEPKAVYMKKVKANPFLNVRNKPSMVGSEIIGKLFTDDKVEIFAIKDSFAKISETEEKWVSTDYLVPVHS